MSLFDDISEVAANSPVEEDSVEELLGDELLEDLEGIKDIDPDAECMFIYMGESVTVNVAASANKSISQVIQEQALNLGLPSDLSKLKVMQGNTRYLGTNELNAAPQLGVVYALTIGHDSKQAQG